MCNQQTKATDYIAKRVKTVLKYKNGMKNKAGQLMLFTMNRIRVLPFFSMVHQWLLEHKVPLSLMVRTEMKYKLLKIGLPKMYQTFVYMGRDTYPAELFLCCCFDPDIQPMYGIINIFFRNIH